MDRVVFRNLGRRRGSVKVGPGRGLDFSAVSLGGRKALLVTVDPISAIPAIGFKLSAWMSAHLIASDFTTSGCDPEFATFSYNFPRTMSDTQKEVYVKAMGEECRKLGVTIIAGHTGSYPGSGFTVVGAGSMMGRADEGGYVTTAMAREGDLVLLTKQAGIEATGSLAASFPAFLEGRVGLSVVRRASALLKKCTTVRDARTARRVGLGGRGVTSMHDATEGGVLGALQEMAHASTKAFEIDPGTIPVSEESRLVCSAFGLDPLETMGEGSLLITCGPDSAEKVRNEMAREGINVAAIGRVMKGEGLYLQGKGGRSRRYKPGPDGYWSAYLASVKRNTG